MYLELYVWKSKCDSIKCIKNKNRKRKCSALCISLFFPSVAPHWKRKNVAQFSEDYDGKWTLTRPFWCRFVQNMTLNCPEFLVNHLSVRRCTVSLKAASLPHTNNQHPVNTPKHHGDCSYYFFATQIACQSMTYKSLLILQDSAVQRKKSHRILSNHSISQFLYFSCLFLYLSTGPQSYTCAPWSTEFKLKWEQHLMWVHQSTHNNTTHQWHTHNTGADGSCVQWCSYVFIDELQHVRNLRLCCADQEIY